jgi:hypothetical protein
MILAAQISVIIHFLNELKQELKGNNPASFSAKASRLRRLLCWHSAARLCRRPSAYARC